MALDNPNGTSPESSIAGSLAGSAFSGIAGSTIGSILGYGMNANLQRQQFQNEKALMQKSFEYGQRAQENAAANLVRGAKAAGLSPLAVLGQSFSAAQGPSGNAVGASVAAPNVDLSGMMLAASQARLANAEAKNKELTVKHRLDADNAFVETYRGMLQREKVDILDQLKNSKGDPSNLNTRLAEIDASLDKLKDPNYSATVGIMEGYKAGAETAKYNFDIVNNFLQGKLDKDILVKKLGNGTADILATVPSAERADLVARIKHAKQLIAESESKEKLNDETVLKLQAEITAIGNQLLHANLNDPNFIKYMFGEDSEMYKNWDATDKRDRAYKVGQAVLEGIATGGAIGVMNHGLRMLEKGSKRNSSSRKKELPTKVDYNSSAHHWIKTSNDNPFPEFQ